MRRKVIIDLATIYPGKGGAGGGIWNYAKNMVLSLDASMVDQKDLTLECLVNSEINLPLQRIKIKKVPLDPGNLFTRILYAHLYLPLYVLIQRGVLHKVYFEVPFWMPFKTVVTIHDLMSKFYKNRGYTTTSFPGKLKELYFQLLNKRAIKKSSIICTPSHFVKEEMVGTYQIPSEKVVVTPLAAGNIEGAFGRNEENKVDTNLYCVAAFHPHKGHLRLIEVFETLCLQFPINTKLYLRGHVVDPEFFKIIQQRIASSAVRERIQIVPYQKDSTLTEIYQNADWLILLSEYEGFGLPLIEAQSGGMPVICSSIPTFKEVAGDSVFYLCNNLDKQVAAQKLERLFSNHEQRKSFIRKGFANAEKYSWAKLASQMTNVYKGMN